MNNPCGNNECNKINSGIDECIKPLIKALNDCGLETVASCCGHGNTNGNIALRDGRELIIVPDYETARNIEKHFPDIHGKQPCKNREITTDRQTRNNIEAFKKELSKMALAIYLACDAEIAADVSLKTNKSIRLIDDLLKKIDLLESHQK